jgi:hypothetical protein
MDRPYDQRTTIMRITDHKIEYTRLLRRYARLRVKQKIIASEGIFCWQNTGNLYIHVHRATVNDARDSWDELSTSRLAKPHSPAGIKKVD